MIVSSLQIKKLLWIFNLDIKIWQESPTHKCFLAFTQESYIQYKVFFCATTFNSGRIKSNFYKNRVGQMTLKN